MNVRTVLPYILVALVAAFIVIYMMMMAHQLQVAKETNTYNRGTACILSVPLATRTDEYIAECYTEAENYNNVKVKRFGNIKE